MLLRTPTPPSPGTSPLLLAAGVSGCATLCYELLWVRVVSLSVGATFPSITVVVAGFMAGLGIGALVGGRMADRYEHPARFYAAVELAVAVVAAAFPFLVRPLLSFDPPMLAGISGRAWLAGLAMLPATTLMGMTFPLLSSALHARDPHAAHVPVLYGANTLGAAIGCVLAGLVLPFVWGVWATLAIAAGLNLGAALLALGAGRQAVASAPPPDEAPSAGAVDRADPTSTGVRDSLRAGPWLVLGFGSGLLMTLAQVLWNRSMIGMGNSVFTAVSLDQSGAMSLVLTTLLLGNGAGSLLAHRWRTLQGDAVIRRLAVTWAVGAMGLALGVEWFGVRVLHIITAGVRSGGVLRLVIHLGPVLATSMVLGLAFPLLARVYSGALAGHGQRMGRVWALNTAGAVLGSVGGGWWFLPRFGASGGLVACAALSMTLALLCWTVGRGSLRGLAVLVLLVGAGAGILASVPLEAGQSLLARHPNLTVVARWEGREATTLVVEDPRGERGLISDGREIWPSAGYQRVGVRVTRMAGDPRHVLLVGFGTGRLAQGLLKSRKLETLEIVELDGDQFQAAHWFGTEGVLADPRVHAVVDDAMHYLTVTTETYGLVLVDAWGPEISYAVFTEECHDLLAAHLAPEGLVWAKLSALDAPSLARVLDTTRCRYPYAYHDPGDPPAVIGSLQPITDLPALDPPTVGTCDPLRFFHPERLRNDVTAPSARAGPHPRAQGKKRRKQAGNGAN